MASPIPQKAVIYCRVSTKEQVEEGNSLASQERLCKEYAEKHGYEVVRVFIELGESAKTADRTELKKLLAFCSAKKNNVSAVIAYKIDRISRNTDDYSQIRMNLRRYGVEIKSTSEYFEDSPAGKFMENILANVAQFDNDVRTERSVGGMRDAVREGRYVWQAPLGYSNVRENGKATIARNASAKFIEKAFALMATGKYTIEAIRQSLYSEGMRTVTGKMVSKTTFYELFQNELYMGRISKLGVTIQGTFAPIISEQLFNAVQVQFGRKPKSIALKTQNEDFPLRKLFKHPCGRLLTGYWSKGRSKKYPYYRYHNTRINIRKEDLESKFKQLLNSNFQLPPTLHRKLESLVMNILNEKFKFCSHAIDHLTESISKMKEKRGILVEKNITGVINDELFKEHLQAVDHELYNLDKKVKGYNYQPFNKSQILEAINRLMITPGDYWQAAPLPEKIQLQRFYFPQGIIFDGNESRTEKICSLYKLKQFTNTIFSDQVTHPDRKANNRHVPLYQHNLTVKDELKDTSELFAILQDIQEEYSNFFANGREGFSP